MIIHDQQVERRILRGKDRAHAVRDVERFGALVRAGKLPGKLDGSDVLLDSPTAEQVTALVSGALGPVFDDECPAVLRRVAR